MKNEKDVRQREQKVFLHSTRMECLVLVDSPTWVIVRNAKNPHAMPFVLSRKEWDRLPPADDWRLA